jgi:hypothetical protein
MTSGPAHYQEAERLAALPDACQNPDPSCPHCTRDLLAAQVHATLAAAAAYADPFDHADAWKDVLT